MDLQERMRALRDEVAARVLLRPVGRVTAEADRILHDHRAAVDDQARMRHEVRRGRREAVLGADAEPGLEVHAPGVDLHHGLRLLLAGVVDGILRHLADPVLAAASSTVDFPGATVEYNAPVGHVPSRIAVCLREVAVRRRRERVRLRAPRLPLAPPREGVGAARRVVQVERAGARLHEAAHLPRDLPRERQVVLHVEGRALRERGDVRDGASARRAVRTRVAERARTQHERAARAERAHAAVVEVVRLHRAAVEDGRARVGAVRVELHDAAAVALVHLHVRRAVDGGRVDRLVKAGGDRRHAFVFVLDIAPARERAAGPRQEVPARHPVLHHVHAAAPHGPEVHLQRAAFVDLAGVELQPGWLVGERDAVGVVVVRPEQHKRVRRGGLHGGVIVRARPYLRAVLEYLRRLGAGVQAERQAFPDRDEILLAAVGGGVERIPMAVREAEGDSQRAVHVELEVESVRGVTAHAERPLLFRRVVHERAVHHDFRGGRHVVARVDGLRAVRLDVGVLGRRRQNHHAGDSHRRNTC